MITRLLVLLFAAGLYPADSAAIDPAYLIYPLEQASIKIDSVSEVSKESILTLSSIASQSAVR